MRSLFVCFATAALLAGCERFAMSLPLAAGPGTARPIGVGATLAGAADPAKLPALAQQAAASRAGAAPPIMGRVEFPQTRGVQAAIGDVVNFATVTLYDPRQARATAATVTNANGEFSLGLGAWVPDSDVPYIVEATKGLGNYRPGWTNPRFRTLVRFNSSSSKWESVSTPDIMIGAQTTAVAIEVGLYSNKVKPELVMGTVDTSVRPAAFLPKPVFFPGSPPNASYSGHGVAELVKLSADISSFLQSDLDPIMSVQEVVPTVATITPNHGKATDIVKIAGQGFSPLAEGSKVTFNGVAASVLLAKADELVVVVPAGATTGPVVVEGRGRAAPKAFSVDPSGPAFGIDFVYPTSGLAGSTVTILGFGFSKTPADNTVHFDSVTTTCVTSDTNYCTAVVPSDATKGPLFVDVKDVGTSGPLAFSVLVNSLVVDGMIPSKGAPGQEIMLLGANFGSATGKVTISGVTAPIVSWSDTQVVASVPSSTVSGPLVLTVGALPPLTVGTFSVLGESISGWTTINTNPSTAFPVAGAWQGRWRKWWYLGAGYATCCALQTGYLKTPMQRAEIMPDGSLGPLTRLPGVESWYHWAINATYDTAHSPTVIGDYAYSFPATFNWGDVGSNKVVLRARFNLDGSMSNFAPAPVQLAAPTGRWGSAIRVKDYVYVMGGDNAPTLKMQQAKIKPDGTLEPFTLLSQTVFSRQPCGYVVIGNYIYSFGGEPASNSIWRIPIKANGDLDAAAWVQVGTMGHRMAYGASAVIGRYVYVFPGHNWDSGNWRSVTVWRSPITFGANPSLGPWERVLDMPYATHAEGILVNGNKIYMTGTTDGAGNDASYYRPFINVGTIQ